MARRATKQWVRTLGAALACGALLGTGVLTGQTATATGSAPLIVGGRDATEKYSFMASLRDGGEHYCGASLIAKRWLVTAAHCVADRKPAGLSVRVGSTERTSGGEVANVARIVAHPEFGPPGSWRDIALLKLARPVAATPVPIANGVGGAGTKTRILGWGFTCDGQNCDTAPNTLQELDTKRVPDRDCADADLDPTSELCTDGAIPDAQACNGDSGGPQLIRRPTGWELIGATSRDGDNDPACAPGPGIWTNVTHYHPWITHTITPKSHE